MLENNEHTYKRHIRYNQKHFTVAALPNEENIYVIETISLFSDPTNCLWTLYEMMQTKHLYLLVLCCLAHAFLLFSHRFQITRALIAYHFIQSTKANKGNGKRIESRTNRELQTLFAIWFLPNIRIRCGVSLSVDSILIMLAKIKKNQRKCGVVRVCAMQQNRVFHFLYDLVLGFV